MRKMKLDVETRLKVKKYLEYTLGEMTYRKDDENKLMSLLSESLKDETIRKINKGVLNSCESLDKLLKRTFSDIFLAELIYYFQEKIYSPGEIIYHEGKEDEQAMYLVMSGSVELFVSKNELILRTMQKGQHFGEIEFFTGMNRQWGARATDDFLSLFYIKRKEIIDVIDNFPDDKEKFFFLKDKLSLYSQFTGINHKCYTCNKTQHTALHCPYTHFEFDREKFLQDQNEESYRFCRSFVRRPRPKKRFENYKELENAARRLSLEFSKEIEIHNNEILGHDITPNCRAFVKKDISAKRAFNLVMSAVRFSGGKGITIQDPVTNEEDQGEEVEVHSLTKMSSIPKREKQQRAAIKRATKESPFETGFDQVQSYRNYFPHNNVETVLEQLNRLSLKQARKLSKVKQLVHKSLSVKAQKAKAALSKAKTMNKVAEEGEQKTHDYGVGRIDFLQEEQEKVVITEISESEDEIENDFAQLRNLISPSMMDNENVVDTNVAEENIFGGELKEKISRELIKKGDFLPMSSFASSHTNLWHIEDKDEEIEQPGPPSLQPLKLEDADSAVAEQEISSALDLLIKKHGSNFVKEILEKKT